MGKQAKAIAIGWFGYGAILYGVGFIGWVITANVLIHTGMAGDWDFWWFISRHPTKTFLLLIPGLVLQVIYSVLLRRWRGKLNT